MENASKVETTKRMLCKIWKKMPQVTKFEKKLKTVLVTKVMENASKVETTRRMICIRKKMPQVTKYERK